MATPTDREELEYRRGVADANRTGDSSGLLGVLIGAVVVVGLGAAAYFAFGGQVQKSDSPNIINVPAPQSPTINIEAPKMEAPKAPDVNITVPSPSLAVPSPGTGKSGN